MMQVVPGSRLPNLDPKTKRGLASPAGEEPAQEFAASACQSSVVCFGFLAQDDGSDEDGTIKSARMRDDVTRTESSPQAGHGSFRSQLTSDSWLKEASSIKPQEAPSHMQETSSGTSEKPTITTAWQHSSTLPGTADSTFMLGSEPQLTNQGKADAITEVPEYQMEQILQHQEAQQAIRPPAAPNSKKLFRWPPSPFRLSRQLLKGSMPSAA